MASRSLRICDYWELIEKDCVKTLWLIHPDWKITGPENGVDILNVFMDQSGYRLNVELVCPGGRFSRNTDFYSPDYGNWTECVALNLLSSSASSGKTELNITW